MLWRWVHPAAVSRVGILFFYSGMYSWVYAGGSSMYSCSLYPLTFSPTTLWQFTIELLSVIVDNFSLTGSVCAWSFSQMSWSMKVLLLCVSSNAYTKVSGLLFAALESHTGTIIEVRSPLSILLVHKATEELSFCGNVSSFSPTGRSSWSGDGWLRLQLWGTRSTYNC